MSKNNKSINGNKIQDNMRKNLVKIVGITLCVIVIYLIYIYFIKTDYIQLIREGFANSTIPNSTIPITIQNKSMTDTVYEQALRGLYGTNIRLMCSMLPTISSGTNICNVNNSPVIIHNFPIHIIKLADGSILAVFNDGRLYQKDSMDSTMWNGPFLNSMPNDIIPLRMVTLSTDLVTLLGIGYDNTLYIKSPDIDSNGNKTLNLSAVWKQVPNNTDIIYVIFDNDTNFLISIDINGKLFTKTSLDISSVNTELVTKIDRPALRLYYDINGYMLIVDNKFDLYQFNDIKWKTSYVNTSRGKNSSKIQDLLYCNDGKMYGLIFNPDSFMVQVMKQTFVFYMSDFVTIDPQHDYNNNTNTSVDFVMSDQDIIKAKVGSLYDYLNNTVIDDPIDDDTNFAYQKQIIQSKTNLINFCANRNSSTSNINTDNYDLLADVEDNDDKINKLKSVVSNLIAYEPDKIRIQEKYPIIGQS